MAPNTHFTQASSAVLCCVMLQPSGSMLCFALLCCAVLLYYETCAQDAMQIRHCSDLVDRSSHTIQFWYAIGDMSSCRQARVGVHSMPQGSTQQQGCGLCWTAFVLLASLLCWCTAGCANCFLLRLQCTCPTHLRPSASCYQVTSLPPSSPGLYCTTTKI